MKTKAFVIFILLTVLLFTVPCKSIRCCVKYVSDDKILIKGLAN